jgi:hypothetical protein
MPERNILLERLEKKLSEKEKEVEELKMMMSFSEHKIAEIKNELLNELRAELGDKKIKELEAKVVELSKTVEGLMSEVLYLKAELIKTFNDTESKTEKEEVDKIIRADPCIDTSEKEERKEDFIVCD